MRKNFNKEDWEMAVELTKQQIKKDGISKPFFIFLVSLIFITLFSCIILCELNPQAPLIGFVPFLILIVLVLICKFFSDLKYKRMRKYLIKHKYNLKSVTAKILWCRDNSFYASVRDFSKQNSFHTATIPRFIIAINHNNKVYTAIADREYKLEEEITAYVLENAPKKYPFFITEDNYKKLMKQ